MKERSYKIKYRGEILTVTYFEDELGLGRRDPLSQALDMISNVHRHADHEMFFLLNGEMELVMEGDSKRFRNSVVILPPSLEHYTVIDAEHIFVIYLSLGKESRLEEKLRSVMSLDINEDEKFYLEKMIRVGTEEFEDSYHVLSLLLSELLRRLDADDGAGKRQNKTAVKYTFALCEYLEKHYTERIKLSDAARELHLCEKQVSRVIKKEYKCSFCDFVNQKRLSVAIMMLKHTEMPISEIARKVGFDNDNYFYRIFKKKYGKTPSEYRKIK